MINEAIKSRKNLIVEGGILSGKTTNILFKKVDNAIKEKESMVILDPKSEYIKTYYDKLKKEKYNLIILNLRDPLKSDGFNILSWPYSLYKEGKIDEAIEKIEKISKTIYKRNETSDPFWQDTAADFFTGVTLKLFEDGNENEINLKSIHRMMSNAGTSKYFDLLTEYFKLSPKSTAYTYASSTILAPSETKGSILSVALTNLRLLVSREELLNMLNKTTFNLDDMRKKPTAIFIIDKDESKSLSMMTSIIIDELFDILLGSENNKYEFILDNFDGLDNLLDLTEILSSGVSRNIKITIGTRSIEEIEHVYGKYILNLCDVISILDEDVKITINKKDKLIKKEFETINIPDVNINYPKLKKQDIEILDIKKYLIK